MNTVSVNTVSDRGFGIELEMHGATAQRVARELTAAVERAIPALEWPEDGDWESEDTLTGDLFGDDPFGDEALL